jgi:hypothetical protein
LWQREPRTDTLEKATDRQRCRLRIKLLIPGSLSDPRLQNLHKKRPLTRLVFLEETLKGSVAKNFKPSK